MSDVVMSVIDRREIRGRPVLGFTSYPEPRPFSTGSGELNLVCGGCGFVLVEGVKRSATYPHLLIRCPACGDCNDPSPINK